jgi:signal transduction histidine kinase
MENSTNLSPRDLPCREDSLPQGTELRKTQQPSGIAVAAAEVPQECAQFEELLGKVADRLANLADGQFNDAVTQCLGELSLFLGFDRGFIMEFSDEGRRLWITHFWAKEQVVSPEKHVTNEVSLPWFTHEIRCGHIVRLCGTIDLPKVAAEERTYMIKVGLKFSISVPMIVEDTVMGVLSFANLTCERQWTPAMTSRLRLVAEVLALALRRHQYAEGLKSLRRTIGQMSLDRTGPQPGRAEHLRRMALRLVQAEQQELSRVGEAIHEDIMQTLAGIRMSMESALSGGAEERPAAVSRATAALQDAVQKLRKLTIDIRPKVLSDAGLMEQMKWLARQMKRSVNLMVEVHGNNDIEPIDDDLKLFFYQTARKLLDNVVMHSKSKHASLELQRIDAGHIRMVISDDGIGFDAASLSDTSGHSLGLVCIREEAELLGGSMDVHSAPGRGTQVTVTIPV